MDSVLVQIIDLLTGGLVSIAESIGTGLQSLVQSIFLTQVGEATELSTFGAVIVIFAGVSLAIGLSRYVVEWVSSLGN